MRPTWRLRHRVRAAADRSREAARLEESRGDAAHQRAYVLAKQRKVDVLRGEAKFVGPHSLELKSADGLKRVDFKQCIIAAGSESVRLPGFPDDPRIIDSTGALELPEDCKRLLVIGGGIIGLEMACVYDALGSDGDGRGAEPTD